MLRKLMCTAALLGATIASGHANLVQNYNFGTGNFTDWTSNTSADHPWTVQTTAGTGGNPYPGDAFYASTGCVGAPCITGTAIQQASLSQTLTTTVGQTYTLTFQFNTDGNSSPNELAVLWGGTTVLDLGPGGTLGVISGFTLETVTGLVASSTSTTLTFLGRQDPGYVALDNVDVEATVTVAAPEPASAVLLLTGVLGLTAHARRRHSKA